MKKFLFSLIAIIGFLGASSLQEKNAKCQNANFEECFSLGSFYYQEGIKTGNYSIAKDFFIKACAGGINQACTKLSKIYIVDTKKEHEKAFMYANMSCEKDDFEACAILGDIYFYGNGVKKDIEKAYEYYENSCENEQMNACTSLGIMYEYGDGVEKDFNKAQELYMRACENGNRDACIFLEVIQE